MSFLTLPSGIGVKLKPTGLIVDNIVQQQKELTVLYVSTLFLELRRLYYNILNLVSINRTQVSQLLNGTKRFLQGILLLMFLISSSVRFFSIEKKVLSMQYRYVLVQDLCKALEWFSRLCSRILSEFSTLPGSSLNEGLYSPELPTCEEIPFRGRTLGSFFHAWNRVYRGVIAQQAFMFSNR